MRLRRLKINLSMNGQTTISSKYRGRYCGGAGVGLLTQTIGRLLDHSNYLPPRNVDWVTLKPSLMPEESSVDAAFLALALHRYKTLPSTPDALRKSMAHNRQKREAAPGPANGRRKAPAARQKRRSGRRRAS